MQVLFLCRLFYPHVGGVERHIEEISRRLINKGYKVKIVTSKFDNSIENSEKRGRIDILRVDYPKIKVFGLITIWIKFLQLIEEFKKADIVHIHDVFIWYLPIKILLPRKKVFITFHGYPDYPLSRKAVVLQKLGEIFTSGNICIGKFIEKWYRTKADIISYGAVDLDKFKPTKKKKFKYDAVFASRLDEQTGIVTYLKAIKILKKENINFKLIALGDGKYKSQADQLAITKGFVNNPYDYFSQAKFAFVNRYLAILEAFAAKKLVFAVYDNPLKKDYLYLTPFSKLMIISENPQALAEKVVYYQKNPKKAKDMIENAYRWVQKQTWERMVNNYERLWKER